MSITEYDLSNAVADALKDAEEASQQGASDEIVIAISSLMVPLLALSSTVPVIVSPADTMRELAETMRTLARVAAMGAAAWDDLAEEIDEEDA